MKIVLAAWDGANIALTPTRLPDNVGVMSMNQKTGRGDFAPWKLPLSVATIPSGRNTIYRFNRATASDINYWFSWTGTVHAVRGYNTADTTERTYYTGDGVPKWTDNTVAIASSPFPTTYRLLGVPAPVGAVTLTKAGGVATTNETRYYVYTFVSSIGEESAPSPLSAAIVCKTDDTITINSIGAAPSGYLIDRVRIYRTQSGVAGDTDFFYLKEIASGTASTTDTGTPLGESLPSDGWLMPPVDLRNLTAMWNGMLAGISGNGVRVCVAFKPYAWPIGYEILPPDATPVGLGRYGQNMLVLTTAKPLLVVGTSPEALDQIPIEFNEPCVASAGIVSMGHGVAWPCPDGLAYHGAAGTKILTDGLLTRDDWQAMNPAGMVAGLYEGLYIGFYTDAGAVRRGFMIDPLNPTGIYFLDTGYTALYFDEVQDALYVLSGTSIKKWDAGASLMAATFKSRVWRSPAINFPWGKVVSAVYPVTLNITRSTVKYDGTPVSATVAITVTNRDPFKIPTGFRAEEWQLEVIASGSVTLVALAEDWKEVQDA